MEGTIQGSPVQGQPSEDEILVGLLRSKLENILPSSSHRCIYRVPERIRRENPSAYTPSVVSIGPIHHGNPSLKAMEEQKLIYLNRFLDRTGLSLENYVKFAKNKEQRVRDHYAERFDDLKSREFVEMIVVDAAFLVELLWRYSKVTGPVEESDQVFKKPLKVHDIRSDLMLLENQLPFFLLEDIVDEAKLKVPLTVRGVRRPPLSEERISLIKLTLKFFRFKAYLGEREDVIDDFLTKINNSYAVHFVDFFRKFHVPTVLRTGEIKTLTVPSASELYEAGVKFEAGPARSLFDIQFRGRTLVIPLLRIRKSTESFFLNLLVYERCHMLPSYINDYVFLIDRLVNSTKDVQLLARKGVIETKLPDHQEVVSAIDSLIRGGILRREHFHFNELCGGIKAHLSNPWNKRITMIKHTHFSSPLTVFAVVVGLAIFVLTLLQTICSCGAQFKYKK